jgi:hypothetical protein
MTTLAYILLGVLAIVLLLVLKDYLKTRARKSECAKWHTDDMLILDRYEADDAYRVLKESGKSYAVLKGWSLDALYVDVHDGSVYKIEWCELKENMSAKWRENFEDAKKVMGTDPDFHAGVEQIERNRTEASKGTGVMIDGKPIELLSEVECDVYLKQAIESEDYKTAEAIRKRIEHFR